MASNIKIEATNGTLDFRKNLCFKYIDLDTGRYKKEYLAKMLEDEVLHCRQNGFNCSEIEDYKDYFDFEDEDDYFVLVY